MSNIFNSNLIKGISSIKIFLYFAFSFELRPRHVTNLVIAGARTEYCVDTTCRAATSLGFDVTLVEDGHTTVDGVVPAETIIKHHNHNLSTVGNPEKSIIVTPSYNVEFHSVVV